MKAHKIYDLYPNSNPNPNPDPDPDPVIVGL
jgi:hypothetical protein